MLRGGESERAGTERERVKGGKGRDRIIVRLRCLGLQDKRFVKEDGDQHKGESQRQRRDGKGGWRVLRGGASEGGGCELS